MIDDLSARRVHWDEPRNRAPRDEHDLTDSMPYPFLPVQNLFVGRDVLEIGPGRGRQYVYLKSAARSYAVADISPAALAEPVFADVAGKFLISDYADDFGRWWDVVHFWYVLHHVRVREMGAFFAFVARHLRPDGLCIFNTPIPRHAPAWYTGDGCGTTWMDQATVVAACACHLEVVGLLEQHERSSEDLFVARKR